MRDAGEGLPAKKSRGAMRVLTALSQPKVAVMLVLGFGSGLPFMLIGNTLGFWLDQGHVKLATIGFMNWVGLVYLLKIVWGAMVDRLRVPWLGRIGRRRSWMLTSQTLVGAGLIAMGLSNPATHLIQLAGFALATACMAAMQDTVVDAWRIEIAADPDELGLLTSAYSLGFRIAMLATEALILLLAKALGWSAAYQIFALLMVIPIGAAILAREPVAADMAMEAKAAEARRHPLLAGVDAVVGPFVAFFRTHGLGMGVLMLSMITLYHLSDYLRGPMSNPYYHSLGIDLTTIAGVRASIGLAGVLLGVATGGVSALRLGVKPSLIIGAVIQPLGVAAFALLGWHGRDYVLVAAGPLQLTAYQAIMGFDGFAIAYSGVALTTYMSSLTSLGYTATQYALLTSALVAAGKILKGFSGALVEALQHGRGLLDAYALFYVLAAAIGVPAIFLCVVLAFKRPSSPKLAPAGTTG